MMQRTRDEATQTRTALYRIGELAAASGLTRDTLRYYERLRLLPASRRSAGGFRLYEAPAVDRLRFIKDAQAHGFSLSEIRRLIAFAGEGGTGRCRQVRDLLTAKVAALDRQMRQMRRFRRTLKQYLAHCERALAASGDTVPCPALEELTR